MRNKIWLLTLVLLVVHFGEALGNDNDSRSTTAMQQTREKKVVSGVVSDDMGPIIGATVFVKGTQTGVATNLNGEFKLAVPVGATIVVSFIGYADKEIVYKGESKLDVSLSENATELEEVQVIAYGATKKVTITGAISSIGTSDILKTPSGSITNALAGKITGLSSVQSTGQPGADDATLYVRGVGSLTEGLSSPLILVDGVERSFSQLDPNEIDDITVLKDASATAVFGVRGANGVILVTTKRGQQGKAQISFSTSYALQMPMRIPEFANSYEYASTYNQAQIADGVPEESLVFKPEIIEAFRTRSNPLAYPDTDWANMLIKNTALQTQHNFTISGGSDVVRYFASLGVFTQDGLFNTFSNAAGYDGNFSYNRYNYRVNLDIDVTKTTTMKINLGGRLNDKSMPNYDNGSSKTIEYLFRDIYEAVPFAGVGVVDGKYIQVDERTFSNVGSGVIDAMKNFYGKGYTTSSGNTMNFDFALEQKLDVLTKGLKAHVKGSYNSGITQTKIRKGTGDRYQAIINEDNNVVLKKMDEKTTLAYDEEFGKSRDWYIEAALNYKRDFGLHHVTALAMYNQSMKYYPKGNWPGIPRAYIGFVGRATYDYNTRYLFDFSVGYNGSENFAEGKRFGVFPAGSLGWILSEEKFMKPLKPYVSYMKFRASLGVVGNDRTSDDSRFLYLPDAYKLSDGSYSFGINTSQKVPGASEAKKGNPNVTWETATKQNYGLDLYFFNDRLKTTFDYFIEHRSDILTSRKVTPGYLAVVLPTANIGKVDNKGYEISVKWSDRLNKDFHYNIGFNLSYAKNTIVYMDEMRYPYEYMQRTGRPVGQNFGLKYDGFFTEEEAANYLAEKGNTIPDHGAGFAPKPGDVKYKDLNGDKVIDDKDVTAIGYPVYPLLTGGINLGFSYKGFDFSMTWAGAAKTSRFLSGSYREPFGPLNSKSLMKYMIDEAWTPEKGNAASAPAISFTSKANNYKNSDLWLRDASYLRLKNVEIGYSLPKSVLKKMHISQLRVFASGYNLLTFDGLKVCDPETTSTGTPMYPIVAVINMGLKLSF